MPRGEPDTTTDDVRAAASPSRVAECVRWLEDSIEAEVFAPGARLPSIRALARARGVSPFTVGQAYERLVAAGRVASRRGSGFFVLPRPAPPRPRPMRETIDLPWLMQHMLDTGRVEGPGLGVLPADWLDAAEIADGLRRLGREGPGRWITSGSSHGYEPLRRLLQQRLAGLDIVTTTDGVVLTTGVTQALDLVLRTLLQPGDAVLAFEPCWFGVFGLLAAHGLEPVTAPLTPTGLDLATVERLVATRRPKLLVLSTTAHNPTGLSLDAQHVRALLEIARRHGMLVFEDGAYADFGAPGARRAAAEGLHGVIYAGSFSKTLAPNLRVGFLAADRELAERLVETKVLTGFTTPELNERLLHGLLTHGHYRHHMDRLAARVAEARREVIAHCRAAGLAVFGEPDSGIFVWVDAGRDTNQIAAEARQRSLLVTPGGLFSPRQTASTWTRVNVSYPAARLAPLLGGAPADGTWASGAARTA